MRRRLQVAFVAPLLALSVAACESLLEVDLPGSVTEDALDDVQLAEVLVNSVQGDFECGFVDYMRFPGQWFEEFQNSSQSRPDALSGLRSTLVAVYADPCDSGTGPLWGPLQLPRQQATRALDLIQGFEDDDPLQIPDSHFLKAKASMYEAYSMQLLGEQFCYVTFDGGPYLTQAETYVEAEARFTYSIGEADASITAGVRTAQATAVRNAALVGRARARMYQGPASYAAAMTDAAAVSSGFQYIATYDASPGRRRNRIFEQMNVGNAMMTHRWYSNLEIDAAGLTVAGGLPIQAAGGTPDPRVPISYGPDLDNRGFTPQRDQLKYWGSSSSAGYAADIPFSTWREAQLMIAEMDLAQALGIINNLRTDDSGLPAGVDDSAWPLPTISAATWGGLTAAEQRLIVQEERRRELWMQGTQAGDKVRWGFPPFETQDEYGQALSPGTCLPVPLLEQNANTNPRPF